MPSRTPRWSTRSLDGIVHPAETIEEEVEEDPPDGQAAAAVWRQASGFVLAEEDFPQLDGLGSSGGKEADGRAPVWRLPRQQDATHTA